MAFFVSNLSIFGLNRLLLFLRKLAGGEDRLLVTASQEGGAGEQQ